MRFLSIAAITLIVISLGCTSKPSTQPDDPPTLIITDEHAYKAVKKFLVVECEFLTTGRWNDPWIAQSSDTTWRFVGSIGHVVVDGDATKWLYVYDVSIIYIGNNRAVPTIIDWQCKYIFLNRACRWPPK